MNSIFYKKKIGMCGLLEFLGGLKSVDGDFQVCRQDVVGPLHLLPLILVIGGIFLFLGGIG